MAPKTEVIVAWMKENRAGYQRAATQFSVSKGTIVERLKRAGIKPEDIHPNHNESKLISLLPPPAPKPVLPASMQKLGRDTTRRLLQRMHDLAPDADAKGAASMFAALVDRFDILGNLGQRVKARVTEAEELTDAELELEVKRMMG